MSNKQALDLKEQLIVDLNERVEDQVIEKENANLIIKLIEKADTVDEAIQIAELGTTYKRTGFHFDKRLDKVQTSDTIKYLKRNTDLSFDEGSDTPHHTLIIGDNYDALQNLLISHKGMIDIIYIDPPYGKNDMGEFAKTNYDNAISRDNLLSMLYPRLVLARELLSNEGVLFCSIDDKNQAYVKGLLDEVFREKNFISCLPRVTKKSGKQHSENIAGNHDYLLVYAKDSNSAYFKGIVPNEANYKEEDEWKEDRGGYRLNQTLDYSSLYYNEKMDFPLEIDGEIFYPGGDKKLHDRRHAGEHNETDWVWRWSKRRFEFGYKNGFVVVKEGKERKRIYTKTYQNACIDENKNGEYYIKYFSREKRLSSIALTENKYSNDNGKKDFDKIFETSIFDNPKPVALVKILLEIIDKKDAIILDFFAGSGTTGQAVLEQNREDGGCRKFILCTNNEPTSNNPNGIALDVTSKRLKRVMSGVCYDGFDDFTWIKDNEPFKESLDVFDIGTVANFEHTKGNTPFDVIDENLYGKKFNSSEEKIKWVCENFERTQKILEEERK
ncbi:MAG: site-specific DNA-methyltransferase [Eubacterium sp.]|nr:site-specific DNA-methyltransferase [Eubacterium sp.]